MRKRRLSRDAVFVLTIGIGILGVIAGTILLLGQAVNPVYAQGSSEIQYVGADECRSCHRGLSRDHAESPHTLTLQDVTERKEAITADFTLGEDVRVVQFPGEDAPRAFMPTDIAFVIGTGRRVQRYVYAVDDHQYMVLPAEWNTADGQWQPYTAAAQWPDPAFDFGTNCAGCHTTGLEVSAYTWLDNGVQCEACHGPGSQHVELADSLSRRPSEEELRAVIDAVYNSVDAQMCGQCHAGGVASDGVHPYPLDYHPGDAALGDDFTLFPPDDSAHWWATGNASQPNMQYSEWLNSAHGALPENMQDIPGADDTCLQCHSADYRRAQYLAALYEDGDYDFPPDPVTLDNARFGITCVTCHNPHSEEENPVLLVDEPYALCTSCHNNGASGDESLARVHHPVQEMFEGKTLVAEVRGVPGVHFTTEGGPTCQTCHLADVPVSENQNRVSHALNVILPGDVVNVSGLQDSCTTCHTEGIDPAGMQTLINDVQASTRARLEAAQAVVDESCPEWVHAALDFVAGDGSLGVHNYAYTDILLDTAEAALGETRPDIQSCLTTLLPAVDVPPAREKTEGLASYPLIATLVLLGVGTLSVLGALYAIIAQGRLWQKLFGVLFLVFGIALFVGALNLPSMIGRRVVVSGENGNCLLCHERPGQSYQMIDGNFLETSVDSNSLAQSVHGLTETDPSFGCLDCHDSNAFPHDNQFPVSLRAYRIEMSSICIDCHLNDTEHYQDVLERNIAVGCSDCHSAHYVKPASEIEPGMPSLLATQQQGG